MASGPGEDRRDKRRALIARGKATARDGESQSGTMRELDFKNINVCAPLNSHTQPEVKNAEVSRQMHQVDGVKTKHAAQTGAFNCSNGLFLLM